MNFYPIQAILLFLSMLFAPPDARRIDIRGADFSVSLHHDGSGWLMREAGGFREIKIQGTHLVSSSEDGPENIDLREYIGQALEQDWEQNPGLILLADPDGRALAIEKSPHGFHAFHEPRADPRLNYRIDYSKTDQPAGPCCKVFGAVEQAGYIPLEEGMTLRAVLEKAGGLSGHAAPTNAWVIVSKPGQAPYAREGFNPVAMMDGRVHAPPVLDGSTVWVVPSILLEIDADRRITLDGKPCAADSISQLLTNRHRNGVRHARIRTAPDLPFDAVNKSAEACSQAGIVDLTMEPLDEDE